MIQLNGTLKFRGKKFPIFWTGQHAEHVADNFNNDQSLHPFLHVEIQQMLQRCTIVRNNVGIVKMPDGITVAIPFKIINNFAVIKTAYLTGQ